MADNKRNPFDYQIRWERNRVLMRHPVRVQVEKKPVDIHIKGDVREMKRNGVLVPAAIKALMDDYIIDQESAKKTISVAAYNHYLKVENNTKENKAVSLKKSNLIMVGPTGCGKTLIVETLANILSVPYAIVDATELTPDGYVGTDPGAFVKDLVAKARDIRKAELLKSGEIDSAETYDRLIKDDNSYSCKEWREAEIKLAQKGICFIDELDKLASKSSSKEDKTRTDRNYQTGSSIKSIATQQALLKIVEGKVTGDSVSQSGFTPPGQEPSPKLDTTNILFIGGGAFSGITASKDWSGEVTPEQLIDYGFAPEFIGRFPVLTTLNSLTLDAMKDILVKPKDSLIRQYKVLFSLSDVELFFTKDAVEEIANIAVKKEIGARGLRGVMEQRMLELMYDIPSNPEIRSVIISKNVVLGESSPIINAGIKSRECLI